MNCRIERKTRESIMIDTRMDWLKAVAILIAMVGVLSIQMVVPAQTLAGKLIRIGIDMAGFAVLFVGFRFWISGGRASISRTRWVIFFVLLVLTLPPAVVLVPTLLRRRSAAANAYVYFASSRSAELIPAIVAVVSVIYAIVWYYREK
jgi:hypothetical protein